MAIKLAAWLAIGYFSRKSFSVLAVIPYPGQGIDSLIADQKTHRPRLKASSD
jgi:hypothetical protein